MAIYRRLSHPRESFVTRSFRAAGSRFELPTDVFGVVNEYLSGDRTHMGSDWTWWCAMAGVCKGFYHERAPSQIRAASSQSRE